MGDGNGKIDILELSMLAEYHRWWKWAAKMLFFLVLVIIAVIFGVVHMGVMLSKDLDVEKGYLTSEKAIVKTSVATMNIPLMAVNSLEQRYLDSLTQLSINMPSGHGYANGSNFDDMNGGVYHMKIASYVKYNDTFITFHGNDNGMITVDFGFIFVKIPGMDHMFPVCGKASCNSFEVEVDQELFVSKLMGKASKLVHSYVRNERRRLQSNEIKYYTSKIMVPY